MNIGQKWVKKIIVKSCPLYPEQKTIRRFQVREAAIHRYFVKKSAHE